MHRKTRVTKWVWDGEQWRAKGFRQRVDDYVVVTATPKDPRVSAWPTLDDVQEAMDEAGELDN